MKKLRQIVLVVAGALLACSSGLSGGQPTGAAQERERAAQRPSAQYRVQLGLFANREDAQKALAGFESQVGGELQGIAVIAPFDSRGSYEVASGPMSAEEAEVACGKLLAKRHSCTVVRR